jgi:hypothetical protein
MRGPVPAGRYNNYARARRRSCTPPPPARRRSRGVKHACVNGPAASGAVPARRGRARAKPRASAPFTRHDSAYT